jgi:glycosyltransferase involved in cell wall biosynthesis
MKKILIASKFLNFRGGIERYVNDISKYLRRKYIIEILGSKLNLKVLRASFSFSYFKILFDKYDLLFIQSPNPMAELLSLFTSKPIIVTHHNDAIRFGPLAWLYNNLLLKPLYKKAKYIITTSKPYIKNSNILPKFKKKVIIIPNGVDLDNFKFDAKMQKKIKEQYFIFTGRFVYYKAVDIILKAFNKISKNNKNIKLVLIGKGPEETKLKNYVKKSNLSSKVLFLKNLSDNEYFNYLQNATALLLPSRTSQEGFGLVLLEAMALKVPVIGSKINAMPWIIEEGKSGFLVAPENVNDLSNKMQWFLDNFSKIEKMKINAYNNVNERFSWQKLVQEKMIPLFEKIMKN